MTQTSATGPATATSGGWALAALTLIAAALRLYHLEVPSMWWDEILVPLNALAPVGDILHRAKVDDFHPPWFYLLIKLVLEAGDSDFALRLPSVLAGTAVVPLLYCLAAARVGRGTALLAAAILAVDGPILLFTRQVRPYALIIFFSLLAAHLLLRWCEKPRGRVLAGLLAATWGYLLLHYLSVLILAVHGLFAFAATLGRREGRPWGQLAVFAAGSAGALAVTWIFFHSNPAGLTKGSLAATARLGLDRLAWAFFGDGSSLLAQGGILVVVAVGTAALYRRNRLLAALALAMVAGPVALLALARYNSYFNAWHLSFSVPFLCLMAGAGLNALARPGRFAPALAVCLALAGAGALATFGQERYYAPHSHSGLYKQQARELPQILRPGALTAYTELSDLDAVDWYVSRFASPDPLRQRPVIIGPEVAVDFVSFGHFSHLARTPEEFLAHFDTLHGTTPVSGGMVYHAAMHHAPPRIGPTLPWHDALRMTPWDVARQCDAIEGLNLLAVFGGSLTPETGGTPGSVRYVLQAPPLLPQPIFLRLAVAYSNPLPGNVLRLTYAFDEEPVAVAFESLGNEPEAVRTLVLQPQKPFSRLTIQATLEPHTPWPTMTGNSGVFVRLKGVTLYANAIARETLGSASLDVREEGIGPLEQEEAGGQWRWALGEQTVLNFKLPEAAVVTADVALNNPIAGQAVTMLFNGQPIEEIRDLAPDTWLSPTVSRQLRLEARQGENNLTFRFAAWNGKADAPAAAFAPGDGRAMAAAFTRLQLNLEKPEVTMVYQQ
ncbi:glycosyltransferase family 39 protein [Solidesulfovibrio sp.]